MTPEKIRELIKKVKALADKGVAGESISAKEKLRILCEKYNVDEKELEIEEKRDYFFILRDRNERDLLTNIVCMVLDVPVTKWKERNNCVKISLTETQFDDINGAFSYYQTMYDDYKRYIIQGIIARNSICYIPKQQTYTQENVVQPDIPVPPQPEEPEQSEDVSEDNKSETFGGVNDKDSKDNKKSKRKNEDVEKPIDPIKLMKIAVALEKNPWVKVDRNKKLIDEDSGDIL